jgi:hypothetical protein
MRDCVFNIFGKINWDDLSWLRANRSYYLDLCCTFESQGTLSRAWNHSIWYRSTQLLIVFIIALSVLSTCKHSEQEQLLLLFDLRKYTREFYHYSSFARYLVLQCLLFTQILLLDVLIVLDGVSTLGMLILESTQERRRCRIRNTYQISTS